MIRERFIKLALFNRLPKISQVAPVYALIVLMIYSWTILWFFWRLPSWLFFMSISEISVVFAYAMATNFLESLLILMMPVVLCLLLPKKWFYDKFVVQGASLAILVLGYSMWFTLRIQNEDGYPKQLLLLTIPVIGIIGILVYLSGKIGLVRKIIEALSDRAIIFLYLSIPISLISLGVVLIRNLF